MLDQKPRRNAQKKKDALVKDAREKIEEEQKNWRGAMLKQRSDFLKDLRHLSCEEVCRISRKVLADLADEKIRKIN